MLLLHLSLTIAIFNHEGIIPWERRGFGDPDTNELEETFARNPDALAVVRRTVTRALDTGESGRVMWRNEHGARSYGDLNKVLSRSGYGLTAIRDESRVVAAPELFDARAVREAIAHAGIKIEVIV